MESPSLPQKQNRGNASNAINGITFGLALILVSLRIFVRTKIKQFFGWDDILIVLALITASIALGMGAASVHYGSGQHAIYLKPTQIVQATEWNRLSEMPIVLSTMFTKLSISIFLYRLFATNKAAKWALYPIIVINVAGNLAAFSTIPSQCSPVQKLWNPDTPGTCWDLKVQIDIGLFQGAASVFCDFALALLPIVLLWNIHIKRHIKIGICFLMGLGFFTGICAIVRTVLLARETIVDFTFSIINLTIWSILEMDIGIIAACIPTIRPLFQSELFQHLLNRFSYAEHVDDRQRLHSLEDSLNIGLNVLSDNGNRIPSLAYGDGVTSQRAQISQPEALRDVSEVPTDPLIRSFEVVGEAMRSCCSFEECCHMLREIEFFIEMSAAEQITRLSDQSPTLKEYQHHRMGTGAVGACLALTEYCYQMRFPDEIKKAPEWDKLYTETNIIIGTVNDILSIKKEIAQGQIDTLIPVLYVQLGNVQLATDKAIELLYNATMRFDQAAGDFKHRYRNNIPAAEAAELFIVACRNACADNLNWTQRSPRYDLPCKTRDGKIVLNLLTAN